MERSKIKTFILSVLLVLNIFFLALVISKETTSSALREQMKADVAQIMSDNGITISTESIPDSMDMYSYKILRDLGAEKALVQSVLGDFEFEDQGGNIHFYQGSVGYARFRGGGEFEIIFAESPSTDDYLQLSLSLCKTMGIDTDTGSAVISEAETGYTVIFTGKWAGFAVFNCRVSFVFENGSLSQISGRRLMGTPQASGDDELRTAATALMDFLNIIKQEGYICNEILSISQGFLINLSVSGDGNLIPTWRVSADTGEYYINAITGKAETVVN